MQYKKLWIAFGLVMLVSFAVLGGVGYKASAMVRRSRAKVVYRRRTSACSPAKRFATDRMSGNPLAVRKSAPSGDTGLMSLPTGAPTIFTANRIIVLNRWAQRARLRRLCSHCRPNSGRRCKAA